MDSTGNCIVRFTRRRDVDMDAGNAVVLTGSNFLYRDDAGKVQSGKRVKRINKRKDLSGLAYVRGKRTAECRKMPEGRVTPYYHQLASTA